MTEILNPNRSELVLKPFFVTYGLPEAFVEFLARRKAPRVAQIYYRSLTLSKLRNFALTLKEF